MSFQDFVSLKKRLELEPPKKVSYPSSETKHVWFAVCTKNKSDSYFQGGIGWSQIHESHYPVAEHFSLLWGSCSEKPPTNRPRWLRNIHATLHIKSASTLHCVNYQQESVAGLQPIDPQIGMSHKKKCVKIIYIYIHVKLQKDMNCRNKTVLTMQCTCQTQQKKVSGGFC